MYLLTLIYIIAVARMVPLDRRKQICSNFCQRAVPAHLQVQVWVLLVTWAGWLQRLTQDQMAVPS